MSRPLRVLILEDRPEDADLMLHELRKSGFDPTWERVESEPEFLAHLSPELDIILADYTLPQFDALRALALLKESGLDVPFLVVTGSISEEAAVSVMIQGASDYLLKGHLTRLGPAVVGVIEQKRLRDEKRRIENALNESERLYRALFQNAPIGLGLLDEEGKILALNEATLAAAGYSFEEAAQLRDVAAFFEDPSEAKRALQSIQQNRAVRQELVRLKRKDGAGYDARLTVTTVVLGGRPCLQLMVEDVTERERAEAALRESDERFRALFAAMTDVVVVYDADGRYINIAPTNPINLYRPPDEMLGKKAHDILPKETADYTVAKIREAIRTSRVVTGEYALHLGGEERWFASSASRLSEDTVIWVAHDITERKRADEETRRQAAYLGALNSVIGAAAAAIDLPVLLEASLHQILKAMGLKQGAIFVHGCLVSRGFPDIMLRELENLLPAHTLALADQALMTVEDWQAPTEGPMERMAPLFRRTGIRATLAIPVVVEGEVTGGIAVASSDPHRWSSDEVVLMKGIAQQLGNAAERLHLLQQTEALARQLQHILDTVPEGIVTVNQNGEVVLANPLARQCLETLAQYGEGGNLLGLAGRPLSELRIPRGDGLPHEVVDSGPRPRIFEIQSSPVEPGPGGGGQTLILNEVTEQREKRRIAEHQERLAAIGHLAAGIAHDFNNIIAAIILHSELMLAEPGLSEKGLMRQQTILQQARRAASLTQQVLDFGRQAVLVLRPLDLAPFIKETLKLLQRALRENIQVRLSIEPGEYTIQADPARIQQVFMNLALNARDAMPDGGELHVELSHIRAELGESLPYSDMAAGDWLVAKVTDTGTGISPDVLPHVFDPFFTTKPQGEGTGLGLSQVFGIVKQHGGFIDVGSRAGGGTMFTIYLPTLTRREAIVAEAQVTGAPRGDGETILVVEDNASTRVAVCEILDSLDYHTLQAADGKEALAVFEQHADRIDLVISDLVMPEMGGQALYGALRRRRPELKLILMTGYPLGGSTRGLLRDQEVSWLQKPMSTLELAEAVQRTLTGKRT